LPYRPPQVDVAEHQHRGGMPPLAPIIPPSGIHSALARVRSPDQHKGENETSKYSNNREELSQQVSSPNFPSTSNGKEQVDRHSGRAHNDERLNEFLHRRTLRHHSFCDSFARELKIRDVVNVHGIDE